MQLSLKGGSWNTWDALVLKVHSITGTALKTETRPCLGEGAKYLVWVHQFGSWLFKSKATHISSLLHPIVAHDNFAKFQAVKQKRKKEKKHYISSTKGMYLAGWAILRRRTIQTVPNVCQTLQKIQQKYSCKNKDGHFNEMHWQNSCRYWLPVLTRGQCTIFRAGFLTLTSDKSQVNVKDDICPGILI